jgi:hypothetical protein
MEMTGVGEHRAHLAMRRSQRTSGCVRLLQLTSLVGISTLATSARGHSITSAIGPGNSARTSVGHLPTL